MAYRAAWDEGTHSALSFGVDISNFRKELLHIQRLLDTATLQRNRHLDRPT